MTLGEVIVNIGLFAAIGMCGLIALTMGIAAIFLAASQEAYQDMLEAAELEDRMVAMADGFAVPSNATHSVSV